MEPERPWSLESDVRHLQVDVAELRADVRLLQTDVAEIRHDIRRLDDRFFQLMLLQVGTLVAALASVVTALLT